MNVNSVASAANLPIQTSQARAKNRVQQTEQSPAAEVSAKAGVTASAAPLQSADAASAAIQNLTKNFLAQPKVALLAQATEFSENALRLLQ